MSMQARTFNQKEKAQIWASQNLYIILIIILAASLRIYQIGRESLWVDEVLSVTHTISGRGLPPNNLVRPLYYMILYVWMIFGNDEAWLRLPSVLCGVGSVFLTYLLGCRLADKTTGLIAALLLALSPLAINHSQEVRMYMLSTLLGLCGTLALANVLDRINSMTLVTWISFRFLAVLSTPLNLLLLFPDMLLFLWKLREQRKVLLNAKKWIPLAAFLLIPTFIGLFRALPPFLAGRAGEINSPGITALIGGITRLTVWPLKSPTEQLDWIYSFIFDLYALIGVGLMVAALLCYRRSPRLLQAAVWGFSPIGIIFLLSFVYSSLWGIDRYTLFVAPYISIVLAAGFLRTFTWRRLVALAIGIIYVISVGGTLFSYYTTGYREDWRGVARTIEANERSGDIVIMYPGNLSIALEYYYGGSLLICPVDKDSNHSEAEMPDIESKLLTISSNSQRLWFVGRFFNFGSFKKDRELIEDALERKFYVEQHKIFTDIDLLLLRPANRKM